MGDESHRGSPTSLEILPGACPGEGWAARTLASSFDGWVGSCSSLARVPLFSRVTQPTYDQITECSTLIYH